MDTVITPTTYTKNTFLNQKKLTMATLKNDFGQFTIEINEQQKKAINDYKAFYEEQLRSVKPPKNLGFVKAMTIEKTAEDVHEIIVDPKGIEDWKSICIGFLAANGILGSTNYKIAALICTGSFKIE